MSDPDSLTVVELDAEDAAEVQDEARSIKEYCEGYEAPVDQHEAAIGFLARDPDLGSLAEEINEVLRQSLSYRYAAGLLLIEARRLVDEQKLGWHQWCAANVSSRSMRDVRRCMALARAVCPAEAVEAERTRAREGMKAHRARAASRVPHQDRTNVSPASASPVTAPEQEPVELPKLETLPDYDADVLVTLAQNQSPESKTANAFALKLLRRAFHPTTPEPEAITAFLKTRALIGNADLINMLLHIAAFAMLEREHDRNRQYGAAA